ncbi:MAG: hypothetical protein H4O13_07185 [Xanthomonadales bacterium]|nr:hypothetical protein [Xanthomonadales bacterium]
MTVLPDYLKDVTREMAAKSAAIRRDFATHRLSAGENREGLVSQFLREHLPQKLGISSGLIFSSEGLFSNQADVIVVDHLNNAPLHATSRNTLWPVEAVYALVEVKTSLSPAEIKDSVAKCRRYKQMRRRFCTPLQQDKSLFVIWAFEGPSAETLKVNLSEELAPVPDGERPDLVVVLSGTVAMAGDYREIARLGQPESPYRNQLHARHGADLSTLLPGPIDVVDAGDNALLTWFTWFDSWLRLSDPRLTDPIQYLPAGMLAGRNF